MNGRRREASEDDVLVHQGTKTPGPRARSRLAGFNIDVSPRTFVAIFAALGLGATGGFAGKDAIEEGANVALGTDLELRKAVDEIGRVQAEQGAAIASMQSEVGLLKANLGPLAERADKLERSVRLIHRNQLLSCNLLAKLAGEVNPCREPDEP